MGPTVLPTGRAALRRRRQTVATSWRSLASSERRWRVRGTHSAAQCPGRVRKHLGLAPGVWSTTCHLGGNRQAIGRRSGMLSVYIHLVEAQPRRPRCTQHSIDQLRCRWRVTCWQVRPSVGTPCFESCRAGTLRRQTTARSCTLPVYCVYMYLGSLQAAAGGGVYLYLHGGAWTWPGLAPAPTRSYTHSWAGQNRLPYSRRHFFEPARVPSNLAPSPCSFLLLSTTRTMLSTPLRFAARRAAAPRYIASLRAASTWANVPQGPPVRVSQRLLPRPTTASLCPAGPIELGCPMLTLCRM